MNLVLVIKRNQPAAYLNLRNRFLPTPYSFDASFTFDTALGHSCSQQCKPEQLKRYKVFIDNCLKGSKKNWTFQTISQGCNVCRSFWK